MSGKYFTLVFEGNLSSIKGNPFKIETPFGRPVAGGCGDAFEEQDRLRDRVIALTNELYALRKAFA